MLDALDAYVGDGGNLAYLGGNGFYWVTTVAEGAPHLLEVRRGRAGRAPGPASRARAITPAASPAPTGSTAAGRRRS